MRLKNMVSNLNDRRWLPIDFNALSGLEMYGEIAESIDELIEQWNGMDKLTEDKIKEYLDVMKGNGDLADLINHVTIPDLYHRRIKFYKAYADMIADKRIIEGQFVKTLGYYEPNDGGGAEYVKQGEEFEIVVKDYVTPEMFGAKGDGVTDDTQALKQAIEKSVDVIFPKNYLIQSTKSWDNILTPKSNTRWKFKGKLYGISAEEGCHFIFMKDIENFKIENINLISKSPMIDTEHQHGIVMINTKNIDLYDIKIKGFKGDGLHLGYDRDVATYNDNIHCNSVRVDGCSRNGVTFECCKNSTFDNIFVENINAKEPKAGVDIEQDISNLNIENLLINNLVIKNCKNGVNIITKNDGTNFIDVTINNIIAEDVKRTINAQNKYKTDSRLLIDLLKVKNSGILYSNLENFNLTINKINAFNFTQGVNVKLNKNFYIEINNFEIGDTNIFPADKRIYIIEKGEPEIVDDKIHAKLFGVEGDNLNNWVQPKKNVKWVNEFRMIYDDINYSYASDLLLTKQAGYVNPLWWDKAIVKFTIGEGGKLILPADSNYKAGETITKVGSFIKAKREWTGESWKWTVIDSFIP